MNVINKDLSVRCTVIRGGTSRGLFFFEKDLPRDRALRDKVIMAAIGAPDPRQVDGLGGADSLLSKVCIVAPSGRPDADIECEFANIAPGESSPTYGTNCGNLLAGTALFAIDEGMSRRPTGRRLVRMYNRNTDSTVAARQIENAAMPTDSLSTSGMSDTGTPIELRFLNPVGTATGQLLPSGNVRDSITLLCGSKVDVSIVDAGALYVFVRATDVGLTGLETKEMISRVPDKMLKLERIRRIAAKLAGLGQDRSHALPLTPDVPKLAFVGPGSLLENPRSGDCINGGADVVSRIVSTQRFHNAYAVTAAIATFAAAGLNGSVVQEAADRELDEGLQEFRIGHPTGILNCTAALVAAPDGKVIKSFRAIRYARRIMEGTIFIPFQSENAGTVACRVG